MNALIIGLYGIYLLLVGAKGNSKTLLQYGGADAPGFFPWAASIAILAVMYELPATKKVAEPFIFLLILTFIVRNFDKLKSEFNKLSTMASSAAANPAPPPATTAK